MLRINDNFNRLQASYLFVEIDRRVDAFTAKNPDADLIKLGIGDVTMPLPPSVIREFHRGVDEQASADSFQGYGPGRGYDFLREAIAQVDFASRGVSVSPDEIFISDGAKCDSGNFQEILSPDATVAVPDPVYPVYVDSNVMAGRAGVWKEGRYDRLVYLDGTPENGFVPSPPSKPVDAIYLCFPNNPTGAVATAAQLSAWVEYARSHRSIILFDAAYEQFIRDPSIPHSIFEIEGADEVAVEFRSLSKTAGFTGTRLAYTVVPQKLTGTDSDGRSHAIWDLWNRRQSTKFNGVSFPVQRAAAAVFTEEGQREIQELSSYYLENARLIRSAMEEVGYRCFGGENSPYVWVESGGDSWEMFSRLLEKAAVVVTPGAGFGTCGEGFVRISAFNDREKVTAAIERLRNNL